MSKVVVLLSNPYSNDPRVKRQCQALVEAGYDVTVLAWDRTGGHQASEVEQGVNVNRAAIRSGTGTGLRQVGPLSLFWLWSVRMALSYDVALVHCHDLDTVLPGLLIARIKRVPIIFDVHEHFPSQMRNSSGPLAIRMANWVERFVVPRMDAIVTVGDRLASLMHSEGAKLVVVVHNSRDRQEFAFSPSLIQSWKAALGLSEKQLVISFLGRLTASRYIDVLLDAVTRRPEVGLLVAGRGPLEAVVRDFANQHHNIRYVGFVSEQLVSLLTCVSDVIYCCFDPAYPNNYFSLPNKFFQALAAGRALMATKGIGEIGEMVEKYQCGALLPTVTTDEIICAIDELSHPTNLVRYQRNASRAFEVGLNWETSKQNLLALYQQLRADGG